MAILGLRPGAKSRRCCGPSSDPRHDLDGRADDVPVHPALLVDPNSSLTVWDSSSSHLTLFIMLVVTVIFMPMILAYTAWVYKVLWGKVTEADVTANSTPSTEGDQDMWYFAWLLGLPLAAMFAVVNAMWLDARVVIIGAGAGGTALVNRLIDRLDGASITIIDPSEKHLYQPGLSLVAAGLKPASYTESKPPTGCPAASPTSTRPPPVSIRKHAG
jgi:cyd operon protein YbgT